MGTIARLKTALLSGNDKLAKPATQFTRLKGTGGETRVLTGMEIKQNSQAVEGRWLTIQEVRIVADLRIMHAKVDELYQIVTSLKSRHHESDVVRYADQPLLTADIQKADDIYLWFVKLKEESIARRSSG